MADWTDLNPFQIGAKLRAADLNQMLENLRFLHSTPQVAVRLTSPQNIASGSDTAIAWSAAPWDRDGTMWSPASPSFITVTRPGLYSIVCAALWGGSDDANKRALFLEIDGQRRRGVQVPAVSPSEIVLAADTTLNAGSSFRIVARQNSGADLALQPMRTIMTCRWVAPIMGSA